jgi:hypothetical protein
MQQPDKKKPQETADDRNQQDDQRQDINKENENVAAAYQEASKDIDQDPDSIHSPNDDLDEGETARLGGDKTDLV